MPFTPSEAVSRIEAASRRPVLRPASGGDVSLAIGEPDFATPQVIVDAAAAAVAAGYTHYSHSEGEPELREALARTVSLAAGEPYAAHQVIVTHGATGALAAAILATVSPGDRVVIPEPTYSLYADLVVMAGAEPVYVPLREDDHHLDLEAMARALPGARLVVLCNPGNPTGAVFARSELEAVAEMLEPSTLVISDEAYDRMSYDGSRFVSALAIPRWRDRLIYVQTFSKTYAMTGWRIGYVATTGPIARAVSRINRTLTGAANQATQRAAITALQMTPADLAPMLDEYARRRRFVVDRLEEMEGIHFAPPEGAFYAFIRYDLPMPSAELVGHLLEGGVHVRAGSEFGPSGEGHLRISFATSMAKLDEGLTRIENVLTSLSSPRLQGDRGTAFPPPACGGR